MLKTDVTHTPLTVIPEYCSLDSFNLLVDSPGEARLTSYLRAQCFLAMHEPSNDTLRRLLKNLPDSLGALLDQASQSFAAQASKALPEVAAQHQAVQQELILGEADRWRRLLVRLLPSLKQVHCHCLCPSRLLKTLTFMAQGCDSLTGGISWCRQVAIYVVGFLMKSMPGRHLDSLGCIMWRICR